MRNRNSIKRVEKTTKGEDKMKTKIKVMYHDKNMPKLEPIGGLGHSCAVDLYTEKEVILNPGDFAVISLGVSIKIPEGYKVDIRPRSSTFKKYGLIQTNSVGLVDTTYCGPKDIYGLPVFFPINAEHVKKMIANEPIEPLVIPKHSRLCQIEVLKQMEEVVFEEADLSDEKNRGGFGEGTKGKL